MDNDSFHILESDAVVAAPRLLGSILERTINDVTVRVKIVETEAYDQTDEASHSFGGRRHRALTMFGPAGRLYVYFTYGMHYCSNVTTGPDGFGSGVLIRAVEPLEGMATIALNRGGREGYSLTNGPAKVCQALLIDKTFDGHDLREDPLKLLIRPSLEPSVIEQTTRVGISRARDMPWRFYIKDNDYVSKT